jgi:hypothetical protein
LASVGRIARDRDISNSTSLDVSGNALSDMLGHHHGGQMSWCARQTWHD